MFVILWTIACQAPLSLGFSRQEYLDGLPFPPPGDLPDPGLKLACLMSLHRQVGSLPLAPPGICLFRSFAHLKKNLIIYLPNIELQTFLNFGKESPLSDRYMV